MKSFELFSFLEVLLAIHVHVVAHSKVFEDVVGFLPVHFSRAFWNVLGNSETASLVFVNAICELVLDPAHEVKSTLAVGRHTSNRFDS